MKLVLFTFLFMIIIFSGCSPLARNVAKETIKDNNLENKVTSICYDLIDKTECPKSWLQYDVSILPFIPYTSRFCFGLNEINSIKYPLGMGCYSYDFVKKVK